MRADSVGWPQSPWTLPEGWASSRRLRSVSRRASVRSRWLMRAVSTGGHEGREAGLSESCTFWPAISVGLGGRGGGCRSPALVMYCSRLTSRAQESAQVCMCTTLLEQRSSNSGWLCGGGGRHQPQLHQATRR